MSQVYALHDTQPEKFPMRRIRPEEAAAYNADGFGIFHTVNEFTGARRIENLARINAWAVDMDEGPKEVMLIRIRQGLVPTMVVETKRGYHVYFAAKDARQEHWNAIVADRLVPYYGADPRARDLARILRKPGFLHLKDPKKPFLVQKVWEYPVAYTERQMANFYPDCGVETATVTSSARKQAPLEGSFWDRVGKLDCEYALGRLSGTPYVNGETYEFRANSTGTKNIHVDGKSTSTWIDREGRIGSLDRGGPTVYQWLRWYGHSPARAAQIIKDVFPEVRTET